MSRENGDQESPPHYLNLHNVNLPLSHPPAVYDINSAINGSVHDPECQAIEELSYGSQGNDMKSYSYIMGSIQHTNANSTQPGTFVLPDKSHMHLASCYNQPLQPITTMQNMDMINQAVYCSTQPPPPGFYPPEYLPTDYYSDPYWISQDPLANQYVTENITATKDTIRLSPIKFCSNCFTTETPSWRRCSEGRNLLCNACGLYEKLHHTPRKICLHPDGSTKIVRHNTSDNEGCAVCGTTYSSLWRKLDRKCYCNACAVRFGIGHAKRISLPQIWPSTVTSESDNVEPEQNTSGLLFSSITSSPASSAFPPSHHDSMVSPNSDLRK